MGVWVDTVGNSANKTLGFGETDAYGLDGGDTITAGAANFNYNIHGGMGADTLQSYNLDDILFGDEGSDELRGEGGKDNLYGGTEGDLLYGDWSSLDSSTHGTAESDFVYGGDGRDSIYGGGGDDALSGDWGDDTITGGYEDSTLPSGADFIEGGQGNDHLYGDDGNDIIEGGRDNDTIDGGPGSDTLDGGQGNDGIDGGTGNDKMAGQDGNDAYGVDARGDKVIEAPNLGIDTVVSTINYTLPANVEILFLSGSASKGTGNALANGIFANNAKASTLSGMAGSDALVGGAAHDVLIGGLGKDFLTGNGKNDVFDFNSVRESVPGGNRDQILDFNRGQHDKIDLSTIDADTHDRGNQKFDFIGTAGFHSHGKDHVYGELREANHIVQGDVNGDGHADFEIHVNLATLSKSDFLL
jgi:Ca2+-binding RTX toxin-like protein